MIQLPLNSNTTFVPDLHQMGLLWEQCWTGKFAWKGYPIFSFYHNLNPIPVTCPLLWILAMPLTKFLASCINPFVCIFAKVTFPKWNFNHAALLFGNIPSFPLCAGTNGYLTWFLPAPGLLLFSILALALAILWDFDLLAASPAISGVLPCLSLSGLLLPVSR